jgi:hypothetical protein
MPEITENGDTQIVTGIGNAGGPIARRDPKSPGKYTMLRRDKCLLSFCLVAGGGRGRGLDLSRQRCLVLA